MRNHDENAFKALAVFGPSKGALKKAEIIRAAVKCIGTLGYERTNYETIGQMVGMRRPHVAYHFPNKHDLFELAIRYVYAVGREMVMADMAEHQSSWEKELRAYVLTTFAWLDSDPSYPSVIALAYYLSAIDPAYRQMSSDVREAGRRRVESILKRHPELTAKARAALAEKMHDLLVADCARWLTCVTGLDRETFALQTFKKVASLAPTT